MLQRGGGVAQAPSNNVTGGGSDLFCCIAASDAAFVQTQDARHTDTFTKTQKHTDTITQTQKHTDTFTQTQKHTNTYTQGNCISWRPQH